VPLDKFKLAAAPIPTLDGRGLSEQAGNVFGPFELELGGRISKNKTGLVASALD
jgi:hypothetical protein